MHVACCQLNIEWEQKRNNGLAVHRLLASAREAGRLPEGSLVALPEMFATGFSMNVDRIAEGHDGETHRRLASLAGEFNLCLLGGVVTRSPDGKGRNEAVAYAPGGRELARYCKAHPFRYGGETDHYSAGDRVCLFDYREFRVAPFVCYDLRFPEIFRAAVRGGATLLVVIANWPLPREAHWLALLAARAIENQAYVVGVNRCGRDPALEYGGRSLILDPRGAVLADAGREEGIVGAEIDLGSLRAYRQEFPALQDMRDGFAP